MPMNEPDSRQGCQSRTWILVAEPGRARLLCQGAGDGALEECEVFERIEPPGGMTFPAGDAFARVLVDHLVDAYEDGRLTRLLLISRNLDFLDRLYEALPPGLQAGVDLLVQADLIDMGAEVVQACLPGVPQTHSAG